MKRTDNFWKITSRRLNFHRAEIHASERARDMKKRVEPAKYFAPVSEISVGCRRDCIQLIVAFVSILSRMRECRGIEPRDNVRNFQAAVCKHFWPLNDDRLLLSQYPRIWIFKTFRDCATMLIYTRAYLLASQIPMTLIALWSTAINGVRLICLHFQLAGLDVSFCRMQILSLTLSYVAINGKYKKDNGPLSTTNTAITSFYYI